MAEFVSLKLCMSSNYFHVSHVNVDKIRETITFQRYESIDEIFFLKEC